MMIIKDDCSQCGDCKPVCPTRSISEKNGAFSIDPNSCTECDGDPECLNICSSGCICAA